MKTLGLIGGMTWHSTAEYYRHINTAVESALGGYRSAPLLLSSVDFGPIVAWQLEKNWNQIGNLLAQEAGRLEASGAQAIVVCSNTMHKVATEVTNSLNIPLLHIATGIAAELRRRKHSKTILLGTRYTMSGTFLYEALSEEGIEASPPSRKFAKAINESIFKRLVFGKVSSEDQALLNTIVQESLTEGYDSVLLGCTELAMLIGPNTPLDRVVDSAKCHADFASRFVLE